jgi:hypothetical protein
MNMDAIRSAPPPEIIPLAGNYGNSDLGMNTRPNTGPAYNGNSGNTYGNNGYNSNTYGTNDPYRQPPPPPPQQSSAYGGSQPPPPNTPFSGSQPSLQQQPQNPPVPQPGYSGQNNNMDFNRPNDNNGYNPNGSRSYGRGSNYSGSTNDSRNVGRNNNGQVYGNMPDQGRPLQGNADGYNYNSNNDGIRSNSKFRGYDNSNPNGNDMNNGGNNAYGNDPNNGSYGNPNNSNNNVRYANNSPYANNHNNSNNQSPYVDNRGPPPGPPPPPQSAPPNNYGDNMNFNGGTVGNNNNNNGNNRAGDVNRYGNGLYENARRGSKRDNALWDDSPRRDNNTGDKGWYENF